MLRTLALAAFGIPAVSAEEWAVLVAGSNGFYNYRHQADVCHAYSILIKRGFDPDHIITMAYDDVAHHPMNPVKGKLFNYPWASMDEAVDVYDGCKLDYRGKDVNPDKFMAVLTGDADTAGGKVLASKADDHVFVNFVDHGGVGIIAFPDDATPDVLHAKDLISTLKTMHERQMFQQLVFYLETCESGSMFEGLLPKDLPVYAVTAANAQESSWGTYCGQEAKVGGVDIGSCLGDLFSVNWMQDTEKHTNDKETLSEQFAAVKKATNQSHVMKYGQVKRFADEDISEFEGPGEKHDDGSNAARQWHRPARGSVDARDVKLDQLYRNYVEQGTTKAAEALMGEIQAREATKNLAHAIAAHVGINASFDAKLPADFSWRPHLLACHETVVDHFSQTCGWNEQRLVLAKSFYHYCEAAKGHPEQIVGAVTKLCTPAPEASQELVV